MKTILRYILIPINIILIGCIIISIISPFVNPNLSWHIAFLGLLFPVFILLIIKMVIIWFFLNKKMIWINIIILTLSSPLLIRFIAINPDQNYYEKDSAKVMSYNVRLFNKYNWINKEDVDEKIINLVESEEVDILCLQEYYDPEQKLKFKFKYSHIGIQRDEEQWHMAIYSNHPQIKKETVEINGEKMNNTCIYSDIKINNDTIRIYNIHLASNYFSKKDMEFIHSPHFEKENIQSGILGVSKRLKASFITRSQEVEYIKYHIKKCPYRTIICGDFNDTPVSYAYQQLIENKKDAFLESGNGIGGTHFKIPTLRIDYILHSESLNSINFTTHQQELSDHRAISTKITLSD